jgi:folate-dependent phosphoribosylglycinamide formyltransferase PurN
MRAVFLTATALTPYEQEVILPFLSGGEHTVAVAAIDARPPKPAGARLRENLRKGRGAYVAVMALNLLTRSRGASATEFFADHDIPVLVTDDPYGEETRAKLGELQPDVLLLTSGFGIVREPLLSLAPHGVLSYHHGDMRRYRGQPPALWEIYNGESEMGVTVQRLNAALDAGEPIVERRIPIEPGDTVRSLRTRAYTGTADMMIEAVDLLASPGFSPALVETLGPVYTLPNLRQWLALNAKVGARVIRARFAGSRG